MSQADKKNRKVDLERQRGEMFIAALVLVLSLLYCGFAWRFSLVSTLAEDDLTTFIEELDYEQLKRDDYIAAVIPQDFRQENIVIRAVDVITVEEELTEAEPAPSEEYDGHVESDAELDNAIQQLTEQDLVLIQDLEVLPEFPGGASAFVQWITKNIKYNKSLQDKNIEGRVLVSFIVRSDGTTTDYKIESSTNDQLRGIVLRAIKRMPSWTPGRIDGQPCSTKVAVPINFAL